MKTLLAHTSRKLGKWQRQCVYLTVSCLAFLMALSYSAAAAPQFLTKIGSEGVGAGEMDYPNGIAASPTTGHIYVADGQNNRIDEFTAWGDFVQAWGWGVLNGANELQACITASGCQKGLPGAGVGQLKEPNGVGLDSTGALYVYERKNHRVQKFTATGQFSIMFGDEVNKSTGEDVCTSAQVQGGDACGVGVEGSSPGAFEEGVEDDRMRGDYLAISPAGTIFVANPNRIQEFEPTGAFKSQFPLPEPGYPGALAADPVSGDLYFSFMPVRIEGSGKAERPEVYRLDSTTGAVLDTLKLNWPMALAVDSQGDLYVFERSEPQRIIQYGPNGTLLSEFAQKDIIESYGLATNTVNSAGESAVYIAEMNGPASRFYVNAYGPPPLNWAPPQVQPEIASQFAVSVGTDTALLKAEINPRFWRDATYRVQYGLEPCSQGGCLEFPASSEEALGTKAANSPVATRGMLLKGLQPDTEYHYRFVAKSGGGGPTFGPDRVFTTYASPSPAEEACLNQAFRTGASSQLPDCRAYEMVSPLDKGNGDIRPLREIIGYWTGVNQSALEGGALTYTSYRSFGQVTGGPFVSQYLARRGPDGWQNANLSPPRGHSILGTRFSIGNEFTAFSADLDRAWILHDTEPTLDPCAPEGFAGVYRRSNQGEGTFHALSCVTPPVQAPYNAVQAQPFAPELQGTSTDGAVAVFRASDALTPEASGALSNEGFPIFQLYVAYGDGQLRSVNVLPNGQVPDEDAAAGTANTETSNSRFQSLEHAVSADGSRVFWTASPSKGNEGQGPGKIYLRLNATQPQSAIDGAGKCSESQMACTIAVSQAVSSKPARFHLADAEGGRAVFSINESNDLSDLYEFSVPKRKATLIAHKVQGRILGGSEDASRVYFSSEEVLTTGTNARGQAPSAGNPNVYLYDANEEGDERYRFVATISGVDAATGVDPITGNQLSNFGGSMSNLAWWPVFHIARATPSGEQLLFTSTASLTGYDNRDVRSGEANMEVFLYDAEKDALRCVSCNPSGARPVGRRFQVVGGSGQETPVASMVPLPLTQLYTPRAVSDDGRRVLFNSYDALLLSDTNGMQDVYQWEAPGKGGCSETSPSYSSPNGGCLSLISSGESPADSEMLDASASGDDVFFTTAQGLLSHDYGLVDAYDARVGGGLPPPPLPTPACEGEACQGPPQPPNDPTPASSSFQGAGNVREGPTPPKRRCAKGKARRKGRCVASKRQHKRTTHRNRRTGR